MDRIVQNSQKLWLEPFSCFAPANETVQINRKLLCGWM